MVVGVTVRLLKTVEPLLMKLYHTGVPEAQDAVNVVGDAVTQKAVLGVTPVETGGGVGQ